MYGIQIKLWNPHASDHVWVWSSPSGSSRYEFHTEREAIQTKNMCYPRADPNFVRVSEIED